MCRDQMLPVSEILEKSEACDKKDSLCVKATGNALDRPENWVGQCLKESPRQCQAGIWSLRYNARRLAL